jgi:hypothetical protein
MFVMSECFLRALKCTLTRVVREGRAAVNWAVELNQPESIQALARMKADINILDKCSC